MNYESAENIKRFFKQINDSNVRYALIKNVDDELPERLPVSKDIDIIVHGDDVKNFHRFIKHIARKINHPYSVINGWSYLYGLPEFEFWRLFMGKDLYLDVTYKLCCQSTTPKTWLPLDSFIQEYLWNHIEYDELNNWFILDKNLRFVYYIVRCVFDKRVFSDRYKKTILKEKSGIDVGIIKKMFKPIFFRFTPTLIRLIEEEKFDEIRKAYLGFAEY
jgi:hypothetical protein